MPNENARAKGQRLLTEGRLTITKLHDAVIAAECKGDSGEIYTLGYHPRTGWLCRCPARGTCSHLRALQLVTIKPTGGT